MIKRAKIILLWLICSLQGLELSLLLVDLLYFLRVVYTKVKVMEYLVVIVF